jgi:FkbM family methyltransferase
VFVGALPSARVGHCCRTPLIGDKVARVTLSSPSAITGIWSELFAGTSAPHFGIHTVGLAITVGPAGEVCAFEPDPVAFNKLELHVRMNSLSKVKLFNAAAGDTDSETDMIVTGGLGSTLTHLPYEDESPYLRKNTIRIRTIRLGTLVNTGMIRAPDFVKVDVQGHGARALLGAKRSITGTRPTILFSSHSARECDGVRQLVKDLGYRCYNSKGNKVTWIEDYTDTAILVAR